MQLCLFAKVVQTIGRTELENLGQTKAGVRETAVLFDEYVALDAEVKGATVQDKVPVGAVEITYVHRPLTFLWNV